MPKETLKLFNLPNLLTSANGICGVLSIVMAFFYRLEISCLLVVLAMMFDFLDGFIARRLQLSSAIGKDLDSLADMISFGIAPAILLFLCIEIQINGSMEASFQKFHALSFQKIEDFLCFFPLSISFCSMFRLAKFNHDERQNERFIGLPTPANALFFLFFPLMIWQTNSMETPIQGITLFFLNPWFMALVSFFFPLLLLAEWPLLSLKFKSFAWAENRLRFLLLGISLITILLMHIYAIPIIILLYLLLSLFEPLITPKTP